MNPLDELAEAARNYEAPLSLQALQLAEAYVSFLATRNATVNLTSETDPGSLYLRHLADGLPAASYLKRALAETPTPRVADLGSGGGFIGFAIKLAWPEAEVTLIEARQRRFDFLNAAALRSGLKGLRVIKARAGRQHVGAAFDAVVERALSALPQAILAAAPLVKPGGLFLAYQSLRPNPREAALARALARAGLRFADIMAYRLPREERERFLAVFRRPI